MENKSSVKSIIKLGVIALLLSTTSAQQIPMADMGKDGVILDNLSKAVAPLKQVLEPYKTNEGEFKRGEPKTHDKQTCETHPEDPQCGHETMHESKMIGAGHHVRAETNTPIIGVLMQPIPEVKDGNSERWSLEYERLQKLRLQELQENHPHMTLEEVYPKKSYIESSHVKFLESAGARVVPIDWNLPINKIQELLAQINGVYIPGDQKLFVQDAKSPYTRMVRQILSDAQIINEKSSKHFPILGVGYGMFSMIKTQIYDDQQLEPFRAQGQLQLNLAHDPINTYVFDEYEKMDLEKILDNVKFFADVEVGVTMSDFILQYKTLSHLFAPICSFNDKAQDNQDSEMVAMIEGIVYPWFGTAYRIDRIQNSMENAKRDHTDHSRNAIIHAQKIGNLFVDEARLSTNEYSYVAEEVAAVNLLLENDAHRVEVPIVQSKRQTIRTELYLF